MSPHLLATTLLLAGLAGAASAAQVEDTDLLADAASHGAAVVDLTSPLPAMKADREAWSMTESWTIPAVPMQRMKSFAAASAADEMGHVAASVSEPSFPLALRDAHEGSSPVVLGTRGTKDLGAFLGGGGVFERLPDGTIKQVE